MQLEPDRPDLKPGPCCDAALQPLKARIGYVCDPAASLAHEIDVARRLPVVAPHWPTDLLDQSEVGQQAERRVHGCRADPGEPPVHYRVNGFHAWVVRAAHHRIVDRHPLRSQPSPAGGQPPPERGPPAGI